MRVSHIIWLVNLIFFEDTGILDKYWPRYPVPRLHFA